MTFPVPGVSIDAGETKEVTDEVADALAGNAWIKITGVAGTKEDTKIDTTDDDNGEKPHRSKTFISNKDNN